MKCCYHNPEDPESCQDDIANEESSVCWGHKVEYKTKKSFKHLTIRQFQDKILSWKKSEQKRLI